MEGRRLVDTIKVRFIGTLLVALPARRKLTLDGGVRFYHDGEDTCKAEVELPKLLWGHNGHLLANQVELDESITRFRSILLKVVDFASWELVLIDLVWQFQTRPADVILAHQWLRFPGVRSWPSLLCGDKETSWRGTRLALKFYRKADDVLRVELRLAGGPLRQRINAKASLNFPDLYTAYREELLKLPAVELPERRKHSLADIIASLPKELQNGAILEYQQGRTARAVSGFKHAVSIARIRRIDWNFERLLPAGKPPPIVNCEPQGRRTAKHSRTKTKQLKCETSLGTGLTHNDTQRNVSSDGQSQCEK